MEKIIDLELGAKVVGGSEDIAKEMLRSLLDLLPGHESILNKAYKNKDFKSMLAETHKLHGGTCYCGTPRLKNAASELEQALKHDEDSVDANYKTLLEEIAAYKQAYQEMKL